MFILPHKSQTVHSCTTNDASRHLFFAVKFGWYYKKHYFCIAFGEMHCTK